MWPFPDFGINKNAKPTFLFLVDLAWKTRLHVPVAVALLFLLTGIRMELDVTFMMNTVRRRLRDRRHRRSDEDDDLSDDSMDEDWIDGSSSASSSEIEYLAETDFETDDYEEAVLNELGPFEDVIGLIDDPRLRYIMERIRTNSSSVSENSPEPSS